MIRRWLVAAGAAVLFVQVTLAAQALPAVNLPASPRGLAAVQVSGEWIDTANGPQYRNGRWISIDYGRPILRGRPDIFGSGDNYGRTIMDGAPVWRAGANATTRLTTQVPLQFGGTTVEPGIYNVLVDLTGGNWNLVLSTQPIQQQFNPDDTVNLFGSINYDPAFDVLRAPMTVGSVPGSYEQFTIDFIDVTNTGGTLLMVWDTTAARIPFTVR